MLLCIYTVRIYCPIFGSSSTYETVAAAAAAAAAASAAAAVAADAGAAVAAAVAAVAADAGSNDAHVLHGLGRLVSFSVTVGAPCWCPCFISPLHLFPPNSVYL